MTPETEYKRKFLVLIDDTPECDRAVTFAAHRVKRTGGTVVLLSVIETADFQQFLGVEEVMRAEAREEAERLIAEDPGIAILVLAASPSKDGPGPLVTAFAGRSGLGALPILITIVPSSMTDEQIVAVA